MQFYQLTLPDAVSMFVKFSKCIYCRNYPIEETLLAKSHDRSFPYYESIFVGGDVVCALDIPGLVSIESLAIDSTNQLRE